MYAVRALTTRGTHDHCLQLIFYTPPRHPDTYRNTADIDNTQWSLLVAVCKRPRRPRLLLQTHSTRLPSAATRRRQLSKKLLPNPRLPPPKPPRLLLRSARRSLSLKM